MTQLTIHDKKKKVNTQRGDAVNSATVKSPINGPP